MIIIKKSKAKQTRAGFAVSTILQKYSSSILERNPITAFVKILATISNKIFNNSHPISFSMFFDYQAIKEYDEFEEWIDGSTKLRYSPYSREAQAHISGWAMKYTNNHNKFVLKKTCVGVLLCSDDCTLPNGLKIVVRPAISDKGKRTSCLSTWLSAHSQCS